MEPVDSRFVVVVLGVTGLGGMLEAAAERLPSLMGSMDGTVGVPLDLRPCDQAL